LGGWGTFLCIFMRHLLQKIAQIIKKVLLKTHEMYFIRYRVLEKKHVMIYIVYIR